MTSPSRLAVLRNLYDNRAPGYDSEPSTFHSRQAADYINYISPSPALKILDLACGTGGLTLPFAEAVSPSGIVIGVDISTVSLDIAKKKANGRLLKNVTFLEHDISTVGELNEVRNVAIDGGFDIITCAAAMVLLGDAATAVKTWAQLLAPNGRIVFDIVTPSSFITGLLLEKIGSELGLLVPYSRAPYKLIEDVRRLLQDAGLNAEDTFLSRDYAEEEVVILTDEENAGGLWEEMVSKGNGFQANFFQQLEERDEIESAKRVFTRELQELGGDEGRVKQEIRVWMGVGRKM